MSRLEDRWPRLIVAVAVVSALGAACGGQGKAETAAQKEAGGAEAGSTTTTTSAGGGTGGPAGGATEKADSGAGSGPTSTTTAPPALSSSADGTPDPYEGVLPMSADVATACVRPGGTQTVIIHTVPQSGVAFDTVYADGLSGLNEGHYGGNAGGYVDDEGTYTSTWVVAPTAPEGVATVNVLGSRYGSGMGETHTYFSVSDAVGLCDPVE